MKKLMLFSVCAVLLVITGCNHKDGGSVLIPDTPRSEVPDALVGQWLNGTFAMSNWYTYDGQYAGNPFSSSRAFTFTKDGHAEFFQIIKTFDGVCATDAMTEFKGTVKFDANDGSFTFYPQQGKFRGYYSCLPSKNFSRSAKKEELNPIKLYWDKETDTNNQEWMVTRFRADAPDTEASYFKPTNW